MPKGIIIPADPEQPLQRRDVATHEDAEAIVGGATAKPSTCRTLARPSSSTKKGCPASCRSTRGPHSSGGYGFPPPGRRRCSSETPSW